MAARKSQERLRPSDKIVCHRCVRTCEHVRWKQWSQGKFGASSVSNALEKHRTVRRVALLPIEAFDGKPLLVQMRVHREP